MRFCRWPAAKRIRDGKAVETCVKRVAHRAALIATYRARFGEHIPLIRRQDVKGVRARRPPWLMLAQIADARKQAGSWNWRHGASIKKR